MARLSEYQTESGHTFRFTDDDAKRAKAKPFDRAKARAARNKARSGQTSPQTKTPEPPKA